jgi:DNA-binding response OmpR family regulator
MRKKIMVAEQSDAIRSIAESILHQNGYDVITASTVGKAKEFIIAASPNMIIIGADMKDDNGKYLYDLLEESEQTSSIPLLLIADPDGRSISYPDEVILPRPFDQKDFLERVQLFVGGGAISESGQVSETKPSASMAVDDELLDAALGLDNIEVEDSEVLDKTSTGIKITRQQIEKQKKKDIYELHQPQDEPEEIWYGSDIGDVVTRGRPTG